MDFEALLESFYTQLDLEGKHVVDVGAHIGRHALQFAKKVGHHGVVHAFEPLPTIRARLTTNAVAAGANNVIVYPFALSNVNALAQFHYIPNLPEESGLKARHVYNAPPEPVQLIPVQQHRLDDLLPSSRIDFLKVDIEGGELDMLRGAGHTLSKSRPIVAFECGAASFLGYHDQPEEIFRIFADARYAVYTIHGEPVESPDAFREASHAQAFWDYVAAPLERQSTVVDAFARRRPIE